MRALMTRGNGRCLTHQPNPTGDSSMQLRSILVAAGAVALAACSDVQPTAPLAAPVAPNFSQGGVTGGVFVSTNAVSANAVVAYARAANGALSYVGTFATGGTGIGGANDPLQSQFALALAENAKFLVVVNAGSNDVSSFSVDGGSLTLI